MIRQTSSQKDSRIRSLSLRNFDFENYTEIGDLNAEVEMSGMPQATRETLSTELVRFTLYKYGRDNGITALQCSKISGITEPTTRKYLERLCLIREAYSTKVGSTTLYFPNGEPLHGFGKYRIEDTSPYIVEAVLSRGPKNKLFVHITEKRFSLVDGESVQGGVVIPIEYIDKLVNAMKNLKKKGGGIDEQE